MTNKHEKASAFKWARFTLGGALFAVMIYWHVYIKELEIILFSVPGILLGLDPSKLLKK